MQIINTKQMLITYIWRKRLNEAIYPLSIIIAGGEPMLWPYLCEFLNLLENENRVIFIDTEWYSDKKVYGRKYIFIRSS